MVAHTIITGMALGFVGSFHCIGMCGPLALALPVQHLHLPQRIVAYLAYNLGRVATYTALGFLLGLVGGGFFAAGMQQIFSIVLGSLMLLVAILHFVYKKQYQPGWWLRFHYQVQQWVAFFLKRRNHGGFFLMGMANGLLPCGMVYMAIATALVMGNAGSGAMVMVGFGLATVPNMLLLALIGSSVSIPIRSTIKKTTPYIMVAIACLLILRGMNLGIPYISPALAPIAAKQAIYCH